MGQNFRRCDREQQFLLSPDMREWLGGDHLAWFVLDAVGELDLTDFYGSYRADGQGASAHDPEMMVAVLLYSYTVGETSTRAIERRLLEDVAFRVVGANQSPDHTTIARFRCRHQEALADLFSQVLVLCERAGLIRGKTLAVDGTKLHANASLDANRTREQIQAEVERYFADCEETDRREDELYGDGRGDELPAHLADPVSRREALRRAKAELDREEQERLDAHRDLVERYEKHIKETGRRPVGNPPGKQPPKPKHPRPAKRNLTDLDSQVVRDKGALIQGYNAQAVVTEDQVIVAADIAGDANDSRQLEPMTNLAAKQIEVFDLKTQDFTVVADTGYWNKTQIKNLDLRDISVIIPTRALSFNPREPRKYRPKQGPQAERMDRLLETKQGRALYARRQATIEPVFGQIKHLRGLKRLSRRGIAACKAEWKLIAATHNLLKLRTALQTP